MLLDFNFIVKKYDIKSKGVIHIGAHYGHELYRYLNNGIKNILMFEPQRKVFDHLKFNVSQITPDEEVNIKLRNIALGNFCGEAEMFTEKENKGMSSSLLEPSLHTKQYPHINFNDKEKVEVTTLDEDLKNSTLDYDFINIDVQGYELNVFQGAIKTLPQINYIISEVNRDELYKNCAKVDELDEFLKDFGFSREMTSWDGQTWGDALYVKSK